MNYSFTLLFAPLLCKTFRLVKITSNTKLKKVRMGDAEVFKMLSGFMAVELAILIAWQLVDPIREVRTADKESIAWIAANGENPLFETAECGDTKGQFGLVMLLWKIAYVLYGCYLGWIVRRFDSALNEAKYVLISMYKILLLGLLTLLLFSMGIPPSAKATLLCITTVVGSAGTVVLVNFQKFLRRRETSININGNSGSTSNTSNTSASTSAHEEAEEKTRQLEAEVQKQLEVIEALRVTISSMQGGEEKREQ